LANITVDQSKLILNTFAVQFQNNLLSKDLVNWKQYDSEMSDRNGLKVVEQVGPRYNITETSSGVADLSSGVQDSVFGSEQFVVNKTFGASMGWGDFVKIRDIGDARESEALTNAATNLAEKIDAYILETAVLAANNEVGTAGNNISDLGDVLTAYTRLKEEGVDDSNLKMVLSYHDKQALAETLVAYPATDSLSTGAFRKGFEGEIGGIPTMFTQQLPFLTPGTRVAADGNVNGADQNVNYADVAVSGAPGQYLSATLAIDGLAAGATVKDGEIFTIADVNAWDNRMGGTLARLQQFRVVGDHTANGSGEIAALRYFPAMIIGDSDVNSAHRTVDAVAADAAVITFRGTASTAYRPRAIIQKGAINVNTADLILPTTGMGSRKQLTKVPLSVRMWKDSVFATGEHRIRFDVALTANVRERRRIVRLNGGS
jgi:hypothetical protein